ncbi:MAG: hypothetical protein K8S54_06405 [Spirochaetia bacterium]|nr:hypothetical protein [Spirochaetia bacterium]
MKVVVGDGRMNWVKAGLAYFAVVFFAGFVFGTIRVLLLIPHLGEVTAVCLELPIMIALSWFVCRSICRRFAVHKLKHRAATGLLAFLFLMAAEAGLGVATRPVEAVLSSFVSTPGLLGLAGQVLFALFPLVQRPISRSASSSFPGNPPGQTNSKNLF